MGQLADTYCEARGEAAGGRTVAELADLERTLSGLCERGRAGHPDIAMDDGAFVRHLARCEATLAAGPEPVRAEDLFLACAVLAGNRVAIERLRQFCRPVLVRYLRRIDTSPAFLDEVEQLVWEGLLIGGTGKPPKLAKYAGRGELAGFVGITAQRAALNFLRGHRADEQSDELGTADGARPGTSDAERGFLKQQYRDAFEQAVREALRALGDRERMIFRLHLVDGMTVDRVAELYKVSQSTVSRWLAAARKHVLRVARDLLRERLGLGESDFDSVARLLVSQIDISVSSVLRAGR